MYISISTPKQARAKTGVGAHGLDGDTASPRAREPGAAAAPQVVAGGGGGGNAGARGGSTVNVVVRNNLGDGGGAANVSGWAVVNETMPYFFGGGRCGTFL